MIIKTKDKDCSWRSQKGVSVLLASLIMTILLAMSLGLSSILLRQLKMMRGMGDSVVAFYAADTGVERALYEYTGQTLPVEYSGSGLAGGASYTAKVEAPGTGCSASNLCIKSVGAFKQTRRAIEIER
jgi:hypothetical protein